MNTYLKYQPAIVQFLAFLALAAGFFGLYFGISTLFFREVGLALAEKNTVLSPELLLQFKWAQLAASVVSFILPALLFGYYSSPKPLPYIGIQKKVSPPLVLAVVLLLFCITPFIEWLGEINAHISFGSMQNSLLEMEAEYNRLIQVFLQMSSPKDLLMNLFIMALLPAVGEELFFRGALQKVLFRLSTKPWFAIVVSSLVFALLHGTFFKLVPIFTLGLLLGTVYHVTRNLWYTITIHFLNNALAVSSVYFADKSDFLKKLALDEVPVPLYAAIISLVLGLGILFFIKRKSDEVLPETIENEDSEELPA